MFQLWRQKIRKAAVAYRNGRLEEAGSLLRQDNLREFWPGKKLAGQIAAEMAKRGQSLALRGDTTAGWRDLNAAHELQADSEQVRAARQALLARGLVEVERYLSVGDVQEALDRLARLAERHPPTSEMRVLRRVAGHLLATATAERKGRFSEAAEQLAAVAKLRPDLEWFPQRLQACTLKGAEYQTILAKLQASLAERQWSAVLTSADRLLGVSPECPVALTARRRAWDALQPLSEEVGGMRVAHTALLGRRVAGIAGPLQKGQTQVDNRFVLWIDAVGGFLVCSGNEVVLGRPAEGAGVDVPILADLARRHAVVRREGEAYLLEAIRETKVDGRPVKGITSLNDGSLIELGGAVEIRFRRPHPLSATARLEIISGHKTVPHLDAVLLMAESCVLGPAWQNHVVCRPWDGDVVLFRQQDKLFCRSKQSLTVDGAEQQGSLALRPGIRVEGADFAFSVESAV